MSILLYKNSDSHQQQSKIIFLLKCISCTNYLNLYSYIFFVLRSLRQFFKSGIYNLTCPFEKLLFISVNFIGILIFFLVKLLYFLKTNMVTKEYYTTFSDQNLSYENTAKKFCILLILFV